MTQYFLIEAEYNNVADENQENQNNEDTIETACRGVAVEIDDNIDIKALTRQYETNTDSISGYISRSIKHFGKKEKYVITWLVTPPRAPPSFFLKADMIMGITGKYHDAFKLANTKYTISKNYISTIQKIGIRRQPYDESSRYKRAGKKESIVDVIMYISTYDGDVSYSQIVEDQKNIGNVMWKDVWGNPNRMRNIGRYIVNDARDKGGGMIDWLMTNKGGANQSEDEAAANVTRDVLANFKNGVTWKTQLSLDHFLVDYDMMEFLTKKAGFTDWSDFTESEKHVCYKNYPNKVLPDWSKLVKESYNGN